jgi:hypothetical protein
MDESGGYEGREDVTRAMVRNDDVGVGVREHLYERCEVNII